MNGLNLILSSKTGDDDLWPSGADPPLAGSALKLCNFVATTPKQQSPPKALHRAREEVVCSWGHSNNVEALHAQHRAWGSPQISYEALQGRSRSTRTSPGRPRTRSPRMLRMISAVPPSIVFARLRKNATREIEARPELAARGVVVIQQSLGLLSMQNSYTRLLCSRSFCRLSFRARATHPAVCCSAQVIEANCFGLTPQLHQTIAVEGLLSIIKLVEHPTA